MRKSLCCAHNLSPHRVTGMLRHSRKLPTTIRSLADIADLDSAAKRIETPCGAGATVWRVWGDGDPIVLLHGGAGSYTHWGRNITALASAGRRVLVPDLPGFGDSGLPPAGNDADALPDPLEMGLKHLAGDSRCDLVGFSFGGLVGAFIASRHPSRMRRLILVGAPALGIAPDPPIDLTPWRHIPEGAEREAVHRKNLAALMLANQESIDGLAVTLHSANVARDRMPRRRLARTDILLRTLPRITCPLFGIWGSEDALYRGQTPLLEPALRHAPDFRTFVSIPGAGHWVQFERSEAFDLALAEGLRGR